jgi:hypothetical protein
MSFAQLSSVDLAALSKAELKSYVRIARQQWGRSIDLRTATVHDLIEYLQMYLQHKAETDNAVVPPHTLSDFDGIEPEVMAATDWINATPLSCDICNFQYCKLPESKVETTYPSLYRRLCTLAAHRLARSVEFYRLQATSEICRLNFDCNKILQSMPIMRRVAEFSSDNSIPMQYVLEQAEDTPEYIANQKAIALQQKKLNQLAAALPSFLTPEQLAAGKSEVDRYLEGDPTAVCLSNQEKHHLCLIKAGSKDWEYLDDQYTTVAEPQLQRIIHDDQPIACITRNSYGVRCLNAYQVMFVDIDLADDDEVSLDSSPWGDRNTTEQDIMEAIKEVANDYSLTFEVYRTCKGLRLLEMSRLWSVQSYESQSVLSRLGSDKLYQQLCLKQECYRARLEIKPWRMGDAVCHHVSTIGNALPISHGLVIKKLHNTYCLGDGQLA